MSSYFKRIRQSTVARNFSYVTVGSVIAQSINLIALIKIAEFFKPEIYGIYTFLLVQGQLIFTIGELGLRTIIIRTIARDKQSTNNLVYSCLIMRVLAVLAFSGIYLIYGISVGNLSTLHLLLLFLFAFSYCITNLFESVFWGHQRMLVPALLNIISSCIWLCFIFLAPTRFLSITGLFVVFLSLNLLVGVSLYLLSRKQKLLTGPLHPFGSTVKILLRQSWPYFSLILLNLPVSYLSNNFLHANSTTKEIGYFNLAQKLTSPVTIVIGFALTTLFPNLSSLWLKDISRFKNVIVKGIRYFVIVAASLCFIFTLFARELVVLFFSDEYLPVANVCMLQIWYVFLMGMNSLIGTIWGATDKEKMLFTTSLVNTAISTPLIFIGSYYGAQGLSMGYVVSFAIFEIYLWFVFKRSLKLSIPIDGKLWLGVVIAFLVSYFVLTDLLLMYKLLVVACIFGIAAYLFLGRRIIVKPVQ